MFNSLDSGKQTPNINAQYHGKFYKDVILRSDTEIVNQ